jgi:DNA polymerase
MTTCFLDAESRSATPIVRGTDLYTKDAEATIWTWAVDDEPVNTWDVILNPTAPIRKRFVDVLRDPSIILVAHQAPFDRGLLLHSKNTRMRIALDRWRCTRSQSYAHGLPGGLELLPKVLKMPVEDQKQAEAGKRLIQHFCVPHDGVFYDPRDYPDLWEEFKLYAAQDTHTLREVYKKLPTHNYQMGDLSMWHLDQLINERGFGFDKPLALAAMALLEKTKAKHDEDVCIATEGEVRAATQRGKLLAFLNDKYAAELKDLRAATMREMLEADDLEPGLRFLLATRLEAAKSSGAKYKRGVSTCGEHDRMRYTIQFCGAGRTGRDSHKGFQPGNMARPTIEDPEYIDNVILPAIMQYGTPAFGVIDNVRPDLLDYPMVYGGGNSAAANALRHSIIAAAGNELLDADYTNIEPRVLAWIAEESAELVAYRTGADPYRLLGAQFFGITPEAVSKYQRQVMKVVKLSMGFGGGVGALATMSAGYNIDLDELVPLILPHATPEQLVKADRAWQRAVLEKNDFALAPDTYVACDVLKQKFRASLKATNQIRYDIDAAVLGAVKQPGRAFKVARCKIWRSSSALIIELPNGSRLLYWAPELHTQIYADPISGKEYNREYITYSTARGKTWRREKAWAGLWLENIVQAIANRVMRDGVQAVHADTLTVPAIADYLATLPESERTAVVLKIHDAVTLDVPKGSYTLERLIQLLIGSSPWAAGMPLAAAGWVGPRYGKREH